MQFDRTHVAVRPRSITEICDLSLLVVRQYFWAFLAALALGIVPMILLNAALLSWLAIEVELDYSDDELFGGRFRYLWLMALLVFLETPLAGIFATHYIGQAVFERRPPWSQVFRDVFSITHRWIWVLGVIRGPIPAIAMLLFFWSSDTEIALETFMLILLVTVVSAFRSFRPHVVEILLLERCPLRSRDERVFSVGKRSGLLHSPVSNDCFSRFVTVAFMSMVFALAIFFCFVFVRGVLAQRWNYSLLIQLIILPASMWIIAAFTILIRFLSYLDCRIRLEGWDVELGVRAEAQRQFGHLNGAVPSVQGGA